MKISGHLFRGSITPFGTAHLVQNVGLIPNECLRRLGKLVKPLKVSRMTKSYQKVTALVVDHQTGKKEVIHSKRLHHPETAIAPATKPSQKEHIYSSNHPFSCATVDRQKSCITKDDDYPIIYKALTIPGGCLGFRPSAVCQFQGVFFLFPRVREVENMGPNGRRLWSLKKWPGRFEMARPKSNDGWKTTLPCKTN